MLIIYKYWMFTGKGNCLSLEPNGAKQVSAILLNSLSYQIEDRRFWRSSLRTPQLLLPTEGEDRGKQRGWEPWTNWWGFRWSCVAGTWAKLTFFTGGHLGTGGMDTKAGTRWGRPRRGDTAGTTGTEDITGFNLSTETESDLSPIWRIKNFSDLRSTQ